MKPEKNKTQLNLNILWMLLITLISTNTQAIVPQAERDALVALYSSTDGANWTDNSNWLVGDPCIDAWFGITCITNQVTEIDLFNNNLIGNMPIEVGNFTNLTVLKLEFNQLSGVIPSSIGNLTNLLQLYLDNNQLSGIIPVELGNLANLQNLGLFSNQLTGTIPTELSNLSNLQQLALSNNQLTGDVPSWLGTLNQLSSLSLYANQLSGTVPTSLGDLANLRFLRLNDNQLTGTIPVSLGNLSNITLLELNLANNQLTGSIPSALGNLSSLWYLQLNNNQLTGSIPISLGNLASLLELNLSRNNLTGAIPFQLANLTSLEKFDLSYNFDLGSGTITMSWLGNLVNLTYLDLDFCCFPLFDFNFDIPSEIGNLTNLEHLGIFSFYNQSSQIPSWLENLTNLTYISLNIFKLTGEIPLWLGSRTNLQHLRIKSYTGQLTGGIPIELSNLTNLDYLYLSGGLSGEVPLWATTLTNLKVLVLSNNKLTGTIPIELGNLVNLTWLSLEKNNLTGTIPSELQNLSNIELLYFNDNQLSGILPNWLGEFTQLKDLYFSSNQFNGEIPQNITSLGNLIALDTRFNALYSNDASINDFINTRPCYPGTTRCADDWKTTQTTAPQNLQIVATSNNSISLNWDEVSYLPYGGYKIFMSTDVNGPFTEVIQMPSKQVTAYTQGELDTGINYYFKVKTFTDPHINNQNLVISDTTPNVSDTTLLTAGSVDLWSIISIDNMQQVLVGNSIQYTITVGNSGIDNAIGVGFRHNIPTGLINGTWTCSATTGTAICPTIRATGNADLIINLPTNSTLEFTFNAQVDVIDGQSLLITNTITPPDGFSDTDLMTNFQILNIEHVFTNGFE